MSRKIIISESQYKRVFLNEVQTLDTDPINPNSELSLDMIPGTINVPCKPKNIIGGSISGLDPSIDWCEVTKFSDCYMGNCSSKYKGVVYTWKQDSELGDKRVNPLHKEFEGYILNWNKVLNKFNNLKSLSKWDGSILLIDKKWLTSNDISKVFNRNSYNSNSIGIGTTNIFNPGWVIQEYFKYKDALETDLLSIIYQEEWKTSVKEAEEEYRKKYQKYKNELNKWNENFLFKIIAKESEYYTKNNIYHPSYNVNVRQEENYPRPLKLDTKYFDKNNPFGKSHTKSDETSISYDYKKKIKPDNVKDFQDWLDSKNLKWVNGVNLNKGAGYGNFGSYTSAAWDMYGIIYDYEKGNTGNKIPPMPVAPGKPEILLPNTKRNNLSDLENTIENFKLLLSAIDSFNSLILTQNNNDIVEFCNTNLKVNSLGQAVPESSVVRINSGTKDSKMLFWYRDICPDNGGVWVYSQGKNSKSCGCVRTPNIDGLYSSGKVTNFAKTLEYRLSTTDLRTPFEKISDWAEGCSDDWHCLADVASIGVLFLPVPGLNVALSAAIDLISAAGYVIEGEEGWELNAGLTFLGAAFSGFDAYKYTNKALKGSKDVIKLSNGLNKGLQNAEKIKLSPEWSKLSKTEQATKYSNEFRKGLKGMTSQELKDLSNIMRTFSKEGDELLMGLQKVMGDLKTLSTAEKAGFKDITDKILKDQNFKNIIAKEIVENGGKVDLKSIIKKHGSQSILKSTLVNSALFSAMQVWPEETAELIKKAIKLIDLIPGVDGALSKYLGMKDKGGTDDANSHYILNKLKELENYGPTIDAVNNIINSEYYSFLLKKYDIKVDTEIIKLILNGKNSIIGKPLEVALMLLNDFISIEKTLTDEGKTFDEIKNKLQENYDHIINYLKDESKKETIFDKLDAEMSPWSKEEEKRLKEEGYDVENMSVVF